MKTSVPGSSRSTAPSMSAALSTSTRVTPAGRRQTHRSRHQHHAGARLARRLRDREAHLPGAAVADEAHRVDALARRARGDEHAPPGERAAVRAAARRAARRDPGLEHAARAALPAGLVALPGTENVHAALRRASRRWPRRGVRPHQMVHGGRDGDRRLRSRGTGSTADRPPDPPARRARKSALAGAISTAPPSARARCVPWPLPPPRSHSSLRTGRPETAWKVVAVTNSRAAAVITTCTSAPRSRRRRTRSGLL